MEAAKEKSVTGSGDNFYFPNRRILSYIGLLILALSMPLPQSYCGNYDGHLFLAACSHGYSLCRWF